MRLETKPSSKQGTQRLFSVKYLSEEAKISIAQEGLKISRWLSIHIRFRSLSVNFSTTFGIWVCHIRLLFV